MKTESSYPETQKLLDRKERELKKLSKDELIQGYLCMYHISLQKTELIKMMDDMKK